MTIQGVLTYNPVEVGGWNLRVSETEVYDLVELPEEFQIEGLEVLIEGEVDPDQMGINMTGTRFLVKSCQRVAEK